MTIYDEERLSERFWLRVGPCFKRDLEAAARADRRDVAEWARIKLEAAVAQALEQTKLVAG